MNTIRTAIIDMGTNTFNLLIADIGLESYSIVFRNRIAVKLGKEGISNNRLSQQAFARGIGAIRQHHRKILEMDVIETLAFATSAIRTAANGNDFVRSVSSDLGIPVRIITGDEEAEYIYHGIKQAVPLTEEKTLMLDIGGGSCEFIIADYKQIYWKKSFDLGIARLLEKFTPSDPITDSEITHVQNYIWQEIQPLREAMLLYHPEVLVGSSGSFKTLANMVIRKNGSDRDVNNSRYNFINLNDYQSLHTEIISSTLAERKKMPGIDPMRVEMMVLGSILVNLIITRFEIVTLIQSRYAVKEGIIQKLMEKEIHEILISKTK